MLRENIKKVIDEKLDEYFNNVVDLFNHPELGMKEFYASKLLSDQLKKEGFEVTVPYILDTAYLGVYKAKKSGPTIGYMCEYDALPGVGHGCGHNMICNISILAATALKSVVDEIGGTIKVIGTPAEENFGGKVKLANAHAFDDLDAALMIHPGSKNGVGSRSNAIVPLKFTFHGINAHACAPWNGASALDAAVQTYQGINMMRQFAKPGSFIHGIFRDGGDAANIIPSHASLEYYFRGNTIEYATSLKDRAVEIAEGACKMTKCSFETEAFEETYCDTKINYTLADALAKEMKEIGVEDVNPVKEEMGGSSDVGNVSYVCPTVQGGIKICDETVNGHSIEFANSTISQTGKNALMYAAKSLALLGYDLITDESLLNKVKEEFESTK